MILMPLPVEVVERFELLLAERLALSIRDRNGLRFPGRVIRVEGTQ